MRIICLITALSEQPKLYMVSWRRASCPHCVFKMEEELPAGQHPREFVVIIKLRCFAITFFLRICVCHFPRLPHFPQWKQTPPSMPTLDSNWCFHWVTSSYVLGSALAAARVLWLMMSKSLAVAWSTIKNQSRFHTLELHIPEFIRAAHQCTSLTLSHITLHRRQLTLVSDPLVWDAVPTRDGIGPSLSQVLCPFVLLHSAYWRASPGSGTEALANIKAGAWCGFVKCLGAAVREASVASWSKSRQIQKYMWSSVCVCLFGEKANKWLGKQWPIYTFFRDQLWLDLATLTILTHLKANNHHRKWSSSPYLY